MYSNNIVNFQESMTILNARTKKSGNLLYAARILFIFTMSKKIFLQISPLPSLPKIKIFDIVFALKKETKKKKSFSRVIHRRSINISVQMP